MGTHPHDNHLHLHRKENVSSSSFTAGDYIITDGQPWGGVTVVNDSDDMTNIDVNAGRHGSSDCAKWFCNFVNNDATHMIHTLGGDKKPDKLNFAVKGILNINGYEFSICIGQGHHDDSNNWHFASQSLKADSNNKNGTIGTSVADSFRISQTGTYGFNLSQSK